MRTVRVAEAQALLREGGADAWPELVRRFGRNFRLQGSVISADPEVARAVLTRRPHVERRASPYRLMDRLVPGAPGILFKDGEAWATRLRVLMPTFSPARVDAVGGALRASAADHVAGWRDGAAVRDLMAEVTALGARAAMRVGYNLRDDDPRVEALSRELRAYKFATMDPDPRHRLDELGFHPRLLLRLPWIAASLVDLRRRVRRIGRLVEELLADPPLYDPTSPGWLEVLRDARFPLPALVDELNHLYGAYNAVDYVGTCALVELDRNPAWAERVRAELATLPPAGEAFTRAHLAELPLTRAFLQEVLRRYPVAMTVFRETGEPLVVEGETLPPGTVVTVALHALHHDPAIWGDPERFRPERWLEEPEPDRFAYLPFLRGPRKCIGEELAGLQLVALLAATREWRVRVDSSGARVNRFVVPRWDRPLPARLERLPEPALAR